MAVAGLVDVEHRLDRGIEALHVKGLVDRALGLAQGEWMPGRDLGSELARLVAQVVDGYDAADHAHRFRLLSRDRTTGEQDLLGQARPELPGVAVILDPTDAHRHDRV